jgi:diguanylate cyclase (GGDEF)-like protein/PAS domain S-box-containing protein
LNDNAKDALIETIVKHHMDGILLVDHNQQVLFANATASRFLDKTNDTLIGSPYPLPLQDIGVKEIEIPCPGSPNRILECHVAHTENHDPPLYLVTLHDVTQRVRAEEHMRLASKVFENTAEGIFITDGTSQIILVNQAFGEITGYAPEEVMGADVLLFHAEQRDGEFFRQMWNSLSIIGQWQGEIWNRRKDGDVYPEWMTISVVRDPQGAITNYIGIFTDISTRKNAEERLRYLATHDPLTGLPNRDLFRDRLEQALMRARRNRSGDMSKWIVAVMLLDVDNFKLINDTLGHAIGDRVLVTCADRLQTCVRKTDSVARLGGDEFTVILESVAVPDNCAMVAQKILDELAQPIQLNDKEYVLHASLGISLYPWDGEDVDALLKNADIAMYNAKEKRNCYRFHTPGLVGNKSDLSTLVVHS